MGFLQKNIRKNRLKVNLYPILSITYIVFSNDYLASCIEKKVKV